MQQLDKGSISRPHVPTSPRQPSVAELARSLARETRAGSLVNFKRNGIKRILAGLLIQELGR